MKPTYRDYANYTEVRGQSFFLFEMPRLPLAVGQAIDQKIVFLSDLMIGLRHHRIHFARHFRESRCEEISAYAT
jgi:hypothetical protein